MSSSFNAILVGILVVVAIAYIRSKVRRRNQELEAFQEASSSAWSSDALIPSAPVQDPEAPAIMRSEDSVEV